MFHRIGAFTLALLILCLALQGHAPIPVAAHEERPPQMPDGSGTVPTYRTSEPDLLVCNADRADFEQRISAFPADLQARNRALWDACQITGYHNLQEAVDQVTQPGINIAVLPGLYLEQPSQVPRSAFCANLPAPYAKLGYQILTWEQQLRCPNNQNLVAIFNKTNLQIEGTGVHPTDVIFDANYTKLNAIRADRSNGLYLRNLTAQHTTFNAIYIMETDGFVIDRSLGRWTDEYGFLTFADDHGLYVDCEAYGNGDSGIYAGAAHDINAGLGFDVPRYAIEIKGCYSHHNLAGYSGTAGDSVWAHNNRFINNSVGIVTDSAIPDHPGMPQNHARFENNEIGDNNMDYLKYILDGTCSKPSAERGYEAGVVCPTFGFPHGTGILNLGGNYNIWRDNWIYDHSYAGIMLTWVPGLIRGADRLEAQFDTSHHNRFLSNKLGLTPAGEVKPNKLDFWWDGQGFDNCWQTDTRSPTEPAVMPGCGTDGNPAGAGTSRLLPEPAKLIKLAICSDSHPELGLFPGDCDWFGSQGLSRIDVQMAAGEAGLLIISALLLGWRRFPGSRRSAISTVLGVAGAILCVFGAASDGTRLPALGLLLLACWWLDIALTLRGQGARKLSYLTFALGVLALLGAIDAGLWMLPWIPANPTWARLLLELVWIPWALIAALRRQKGTGGDSLYGEGTLVGATS